MNVLSISASISVTITDTINTSNGQVLITWKSKMAAAAIFNFGKMSVTLDWIKISAPNFTGRCITACEDNHVTKSRNRKLFRVTSSNERLKHKCVNLSDYNRYLNQIWYRTQMPLSTRRNGQVLITWKSKMAAAAIFNFGKMSITLDWIKISAPNFMWRCITAMQRWPRDQKSKPEVNSRDVIKWKS